MTYTSTTKFVAILFFFAFAVAYKHPLACEIVKSYKRLNFDHLGWLMHKKPHYENNYISTYMYAKDPASNKGTGTKYLFYPYLPDNVCKQDNNGKIEVLYKQYGSDMSAVENEIDRIARSNRLEIYNRTWMSEIYYPLPYVIPVDRVEDSGGAKKYTVLEYDNLFDYLKPYIANNILPYRNVDIKAALKVPDLNVWKFFIINQLMVSLKIMQRLGYLHMNIGVNSVLLRSRTEAGWFDTNQITAIPESDEILEVISVVKKTDKKKRVYMEPNDYQSSRYRDYKLHYNPAPSNSNETFHKYRYTKASNVAAFAIFIINMFAPGFGEEFRKAKDMSLQIVSKATVRL